jgi:ribonuclease P protein component
MKFSRKARINTKADFRRAFSRPTVSRDRYFKVLFCANGLAHARLGMAVSRRNCRHASGRNRIKRQVRESFRLHQQQLARGGGADLVVLPTDLAATICNRSLRASLEGHWNKVTGEARASS